MYNSRSGEPGNEASYLLLIHYKDYYHQRQMVYIAESSEFVCNVNSTAFPDLVIPPQWCEQHCIPNLINIVAIPIESQVTFTQNM